MKVVILTRLVDTSGGEERFIVRVSVDGFIYDQRWSMAPSRDAVIQRARQDAHRARVESEKDY